MFPIFPDKEISMNSRGFTVIELLVSAAILSIIITGLTVALMHQQRQFRMTQEAVDVDQTARAALDYIATEIRNAVSRQGKTFSLRFVNGGSPDCAENTDDAGTQDSPPDCLTVYTWDITRGQSGSVLPSIPGSVVVASQSPLTLQLPAEWFSPFVTSALVDANDLLGFRSRTNLCSPDSTVNCPANPAMCTECAAILRISNISGSVAQVSGTSDIIEQNFQEDDFTDMTAFTSGFFVQSIASQVSEMTIVQSKTFSVDTAQRQLEIIQDNAGGAQPVAGGDDAPGIVDLQFVFNLQDADGGVTRVGVCSAGNCADTTNRTFSDFQAHASLLGREKDIRTVEIYLVVRSRIRPQMIGGQRIPVGTIPLIGDVLQRNTNHVSLGEGFIYKVFSTTVYVRNMAREEFG